MKLLQVVFVTLMLAGTLLLAQSDRVSLTNQANGLSAAERARSGLRANFSEIAQAALFPQMRTGAGPHSRNLAVKSEAQAGLEQVLYAFQSSPDGSSPLGPLIFDSKGDLYGTTYGGGAGYGIVFEVGPNGSGGWKETILYTFQGGSDGANPSAGLIFDQAGNLYGTTSAGGANKDGTVFELSPSGSGEWTETVLYSFGASSSDGVAPSSPLIFDPLGNLYGTTELGGVSSYCGSVGCGTVFELIRNGSGGWTETVLYNFGANSADGGRPVSPLIFDRKGNLYGTTAEGGSGGCTLLFIGCGTAFELSPKGSGGWTETVLYNFLGGANGQDGEGPAAGLIFDQAGNLYGTTEFGGNSGCSYSGYPLGCGTVFELSPGGSGSWTETILYRFQPTNDGTNPQAGLIFDQAGNLYGTSSEGTSNAGAVFELTPNGSGGWTEVLLYAFQGKSDGSGPNSALIFDESGNLYGETGGGGAGHGVVFKVTKASLGELSPASLSFPSQPVGFAANLQATILKNGGSLPMTITSIQITGADSSDFRQSSNCPATLPPNSSCMINVSFDPTTSGTRNGVLTIIDSAINTPQTVPLTGMGQDFSMAPSSGASATVTPGKNAQYTIALAPLDGFSETVALSCTGAPAMSTCSVSPSSWKLNGSSPTPVTVLVATTASSAGLIYPGGLAPTNTRIALWLAFSGLPAVVLLGTGRKRRGSAICGVLLLCVLSLVTMWSACGGGSGMGGSGTPAGTYTLTVTGTYSSGSASLEHSTKLTLVVQ